MLIPKDTRRTLATIHLPRTVLAIIAHAQAIVAAMTDNPHFPSPVPPLWVVSKAVTDLENAQAAARTRTAGTAAIRNERCTTVRGLLQQLRSDVQLTADRDPENAAAIIESAGMTVRKAATLPARVFSAKPGPVSGEVKLVAPKAAARASYEWEYSIDGGASWLSMTPTLKASTRLASC